MEILEIGTGRSRSVLGTFPTSPNLQCMCSEARTQLWTALESVRISANTFGLVDVTALHTFVSGHIFLLGCVDCSSSRVVRTSANLLGPLA